MTVFGNSGAGFLAGKQVFPIDYEAAVSQRLVDAAHANDLKSAFECIEDPFVDVNFIGTVCLKARKTEVVLHEESAHEVRVEYEEFKTEVTALFLAAHTGNLTLLRKLLSVGANVNQKLFRGYATTAATREGHLGILEIIINACASQLACEEALLEASYHGRARAAELLMGSDMIRPHVAVHALVHACCRGFVDVVDTLIKCGVNVNATDRVLLRSSKPSLHANVDCNALVAAIVSRQVSVVRLLLQAGVRTDIKVRLGAWSWDTTTGEEFRVAPKTESRPIHLAARLGLAKILHCLIIAGCDLNSKTESGETALMICARYKHEECLRVLALADADFGLTNLAGQSTSSIAGSTRWTLGFQQTVLDIIRAGKVARSTNPSIFSPLMFVTRANDIEALKKLIEHPHIDLNEQDENGLSAAMVAAAGGHVEAFRLLVYAGADVKLHNKYGETAITLSEVSQNCEVFEKVMLEYALEKGNHGFAGFYVLHCAARRGDLALVRMLTSRGYDVNVPDGDGHTPLMLAARGGHGSLCELLISCGARCDIENERHETALLLARKNGFGNDAERVILDELARTLVLGGTRVKKHTKRGKGTPHGKVLKMVGGAGVLRWGKSSKRNVFCKEAEVGPSTAFRWNRRKKFDADEPGMFHVVTTKNKEVHFVCEGGIEMAQLWARGIKLVTREAIFGKKQSDV
ncbi:hypothetical protein L1049_005732 [Liquidambar formosana]|uniref:Uncharacterized protein n=1 Tax=Liquidambar formosana TaxID=63359 RepID=A0AAP0RE87_LIQFO